MSYINSFCFHKSKKNLFRFKNPVINNDLYKNSQLWVEYENEKSFVSVRRELQNYFLTSSITFNSIHFLKQNVMTLHFGLYFKKAKPMNRKLHEIFDLVVQSGIAKKSEDDRFAATEKFLKEKTLESQAQILTLDHLQLAFCFIAIMLGLSCVVFVIELFLGKVQKYF